MIPASLTPGLSANVRKALDFALQNIGVCEDPVGSNRGPEIDEWAKEFGSPLGSFWCALSVAKARKAGGLWIPTRDVGSCDEWYLQSERVGLFATEPAPGAAVLYTNGRKLSTALYQGRLDAVHIGLVLRTRPVLQAIEGNTTLGKYDANGYTQTLKEVDRARVLGYVLPDKP